MLLARGHGWFVVVLDPLVQVRGGGRGVLRPSCVGSRVGCVRRAALLSPGDRLPNWQKSGVKRGLIPGRTRRPGRAGEAVDR